MDDPPTPASTSRTRVVGSSSKSPSKKQKVSHQAVDLAQVRIQEHPNEGFVISAGELFCDGCHQVLDDKKSTIVDHIKSKKHGLGKKEAAAEGDKQQRITESFKFFTQQSEKKPSGSTLDDATLVFRIDCVRTFLATGTPLSRVDGFRPFLERYANRSLVGRQHMADFIPFINHEAKKKVYDLVAGQDIFVIFDGTSRLGEAFVSVFRFVDLDFNLHQKLVKYKTYEKSLKGTEISRILVDLLRDASVTFEQVLGTCRDGASTNSKAITTLVDLKKEGSTHWNITCVTHFLNLVGERFEMPVADKFMEAWRGTFAHSNKAKAIWRRISGKAFVSSSETRWWSEWEQVDQVGSYFGFVKDFLAQEDVAPKSRAKMVRQSINLYFFFFFQYCNSFIYW